MTTYFTERLFDGQQMLQNMHMQVDQGLITSIVSADHSAVKADLVLSGTVSAGFIDTQVNGGGGVLFNHDPSPVALEKIMHGHAKFGTSAMLPTLITDSNKTMQKGAQAVSEAIQSALPGIVGIHFEGPHLSLAKKGIHPGEQVRSISDIDLAIFTRQDIGKVMVTLAPENVPVDVIADLVRQGVVVSLGHSGANIDTVLDAIGAGAIGFTHLFNAMSGLTAREPGMISAALSHPDIYAGIIADLHHVHPQNCLLAYQCIGPKRLMLVTDAMAHVGSTLQTLPWLDSTITKVGDKLTLDDGSIAGSCLDMASAVKNMVSILSKGANKNKVQRVTQDALNMASQVPAEMMGLNDRGQLKHTMRADFVQLDAQLNAQACWIGGTQVSGNPIIG